MFDTDVFVIGGGPAGLASAIAARTAGLRVVLADSEQPPIDKPCGEGLMPDSLAASAQLGIKLSPEGYRFRGIRFYGKTQPVVASDFPNGTGVGLRRPLLQHLLRERAQQTGVDLCWGQTVTGVHGGVVHMNNGSLRARWIIGADGTQSRVRRWAGLQNFRRNDQRFSRRCHYRVKPWSEYMEIHWGEGCQFYVTPVSCNEVCLVLMSRYPQQRISDALPRFPVLEKSLHGCEISSSERGALAATRRLPCVTNGNVALIGDAAGTVDPITGEGICLAFKQALPLAYALVQGNLAIYETAHRKISRRPRFMSDFMLLMDRSPLLQRRTLKAFESSPHLFSDLLAMHVGQLRTPHFLATAATLGWRVATA